MLRLTEVVDRQRVWTRESTFKILKFSHGVNWVFDDLVLFLDHSLQEANFVAKKPVIVSNRSKYCWVLKSNQWRFHVWLWVYDSQKVEIKIGRESYNDIGDLIYLWDKVRTSWEFNDYMPLKP